MSEIQSPYFLQSAGNASGSIRQRVEWLEANLKMVGINATSDTLVTTLGESMLDISKTTSVINIVNADGEKLASILPSPLSTTGWLFGGADGWKLATVEDFTIEETTTLQDLITWMPDAEHSTKIASDSDLLQVAQQGYENTQAIQAIAVTGGASVASAVVFPDGETLSTKMSRKTEKIRVDIVGNSPETYQFKLGTQVLNFADLNNLLQNSPNFVIFVHNSREHRCVEIVLTGNPKSMTFLAPTIDGVYVKAQSFKVICTDSTGTEIDSISRTDIICENKTDADALRNRVSNVETGVSDIKGVVIAEKENASSFATLSESANIAIGTRLVNKGVELILLDSLSATNRYDLQFGEIWEATFVVNVIRVSRTPGDARLETYSLIDEHIAKSLLSTDNIADGAISVNKLKKESVSEDKTTFIRSINLIDPNDENYKAGHYVDIYGAENTNSDYNASGYIAVQQGETYYAGLINGSSSSYRFVTMYDANKVVKPSVGLQNVHTLDVPEGISFVRVTTYSSKVAYMSKYDAEITPYHVELNPTLLPKYIGEGIEKNANSISTLNNINILNGIGVRELEMTAYRDYDYTIKAGSIIKTNHEILLNYATLGSGAKRVLSDTWTCIPYDVTSIRATYTGIATIQYSKPDSNDIMMYLPKDIYVAQGRTIELYYNQIVLNADKYNIQVTCNVGKSLARKFQIASSNIGDYKLNLKVYADNGILIASTSSTIHVVSNTITTNKTILPIGDSLTNGKPWLTEINTLSNSKLTCVGTRSNLHEGRSGWRCSHYLDGERKYTFDDNYSGAGSDSEEFSASSSYNVGDYCKRDGIVYRFKVAHIGAWDENDVYNISQTNPFWDFESNTFSFANYKQLHSINPSAIVIFLGTNGINMTPDTNIDGALGLKTLVDKIRETDATIPICVVETLYRSDQNGIGNQSGTEGYSATISYKFNEDVKVMLLEKSIEDMLAGYENVYICPVGVTHDSEYNYGYSKVAVNPRLTDTSDVYELQPLDSVHPQESGYLQIADELFSTLCKVFA